MALQARRSSYLAPVGSEVPLSVDVTASGSPQLISPVTAASTVSILEGHHLEETEQRTANGDRLARRSCKYCSKKTRFICDHRLCRKLATNANGKIVYGLFVCEKCFHLHTEELLSISIHY